MAGAEDRSGMDPSLGEFGQASPVLERFQRSTAARSTVVIAAILLMKDSASRLVIRPITGVRMDAAVLQRQTVG